MKRAVGWELVTAFAFCGLVALHCEGNSREGWLARWIHFLLDPDRVSIVTWGLALQLVALRWVGWGWSDMAPVQWRARARALACACFGVGASAAVCWVAIGWWIERERLRTCWSELSRAWLTGETIAFLALAIALAAAPPGLLRALARRPVHAVLAGAALALASFHLLDGWGRASHGWGRPILLGIGAAFGACVGARRAPTASEDLEPARASDRLVVLALGLSVGWPGRSWLLDDPEQSLLVTWLGDDLTAALFDTWIVHALLACHLARAWRVRRGLVGEALVCGLVALQLQPTLGLLVPASIAGWVDGRLLVAPWVSVACTLWGVTALALFAARRMAARAEDPLS